MPQTKFDKSAMARQYARLHLKVDPGVRAVYFLPTDSPEREIRLVDVNHLIAARTDESLEPLDFGVCRGMDDEHTLLVLDVTPDQWDRIEQSSLSLPPGWSLEKATPFHSGHPRVKPERMPPPSIK